MTSVQEGGAWLEPVSVFDVFEPDGAYLGRVQGPGEITVRAIAGDVVIARVREPPGYDRVARFRAAWE